MIKAVSFFDLLALPEWNISIEEMLDKDTDEKVFPFLRVAGIDTDEDVFVQACVHRRLNKEKVVGFRYVGYERRDKEWRDSGNQSLEARIRHNYDLELRRELFKLSREGIGEQGFIDMAANSFGVRSAVSNKIEVEPDYEETKQLLHTLNLILIDKRGYSQEV